MFAAGTGRSSRFPIMATTLTWLGHAAFRIDTPGGKRIYVDPFLTGNPTCPDAEKEPERVDAIFLTHGHGDHVGDTVALAQKFDCPVYAQVELRGWLVGAGRRGTWPRRTTRAARSSGRNQGDADDAEPLVERRRRHLPRRVVRDRLRARGRPTIYFAGDTSVFGDMQLIARIYEPDVAVLPIGDHFTMGPREAAVALELLGVKRASRATTARFRSSPARPSSCASSPPASRSSRRSPAESVEL